MSEDELSFVVLFEESPDFHDCSRDDFCTDPMGMSRIALDRLVARWPVSPCPPAFEQDEEVTVVGVLTRTGHDLSDPDLSQRMLIAYTGVWSKSLGIVWLSGAEARGYISFEPDRGFTPISWYSGHGHHEVLQDAALHILDGLPPLAPVCLDQIDTMAPRDSFDDTVQLIVAGTVSVKDLRAPGQLFFIFGRSGEDTLLGAVLWTDPAEETRCEWTRDFLTRADASAIISINATMTTDDALRIASLPLDAAWDELALLGVPAGPPPRIPQLEPTLILEDGRVLVAPDGWYFDVTAVGFDQEQYNEKDPRLILTDDGRRAVEIRPAFGSVCVIENYTREGWISFTVGHGLTNRERKEEWLAREFAEHADILAVSLALTDQARPPVSEFEEVLADLNFWHPEKEHEFFAAYVDLHPGTHQDDLDIRVEARVFYRGQFESWSDFIEHDFYARTDEDEARDEYEASHGHFFLKKPCDYNGYLKEDKSLPWNQW